MIHMIAKGAATMTESPKLIAILRALEERLTDLEAAIAARSAPTEQVQQALHDILDIYNITGQTGSVVSKQHEQTQALAEAMTMFHGRLVEHDKHAIQAREDIYALMIQLRSLARQQVGQLTDIERALDTTENARAMLTVAAEDAKALLTVAAEDAQGVVAAAAAEARTMLSEITP
jgi:hypothetical protein